MSTMKEAQEYYLQFLKKACDTFTNITRIREDFEKELLELFLKPTALEKVDVLLCDGGKDEKIFIKMYKSGLVQNLWQMHLMNKYVERTLN